MIYFLKRKNYLCTSEMSPICTTVPSTYIGAQMGPGGGGGFGPGGRPGGW